MSAPCEECGSHDVSQQIVEGHTIDECGLCGHFQGDDAIVTMILERRRAAERGIPVELLGLIDVLDGVPGLAVDRRISELLVPEAPPAVFFLLHRHPLEILDRLTRSLVLASRRMKHLWIVEASHQGQLMFVLRPRLFHQVGEVSPQEAGEFRADLAILRDSLRRDSKLAWWDLPA